METIKANDKFAFVDEKGKKRKADFTNFELLQKDVEHLKEIVNTLSEILRDNNIMKKEDPPYFDQEVVFTSLVAEDPEEDSKDDDSDEDKEDSDDEDSKEDDKE